VYREARSRIAADRQWLGLPLQAMRFGGSDSDLPTAGRGRPQSTRYYVFYTGGWPVEAQNSHRAMNKVVRLDASRIDFYA
jgi:hypothetical protein